MRYVLPLLAALSLAACASNRTAYVPPPQVVYAEPAPDTAKQAALLAAARAAVARDATESRRSQIVLRSRGAARITAARDTRLLDEPALTGETLARVDSGEVLEARSFDGRYWGVHRGGEWGYVPEAAVVRDDDARRLVTEGPPAPARPTTPGSGRTASGRTSGATYGGTGGRASCSEFSSRSEAQAAYDADPSAHAALDTDGDGRACENGVGSSAGRSTGRVSGRSTGRSSGRRSRGGGRTYYTGPRGGCYYISSSGGRVYVDHSYCG